MGPYSTVVGEGSLHWCYWNNSDMNYFSVLSLIFTCSECYLVFIYTYILAYTHIQLAHRLKVQTAITYLLTELGPLKLWSLTSPSIQELPRLFNVYQTRWTANRKREYRRVRLRYHDAFLFFLSLYTNKAAEFCFSLSRTVSYISINLYIYTYKKCCFVF